VTAKGPPLEPAPTSSSRQELWKANQGGLARTRLEHGVRVSIINLRRVASELVGKSKPAPSPCFQADSTISPNPARRL